MESDVYILYADELLFINFCIDFICLFISARLCDFAPKLWKTALSAIIGGIYAVASVAVENGLVSAVLSLAVLCIMCFTVSYKTTVKKYLRLCGMYFLTSAFFGGCIGGAYSLFGIASSGISPLGLLLSVTASAFIAVAYALYARSKAEIKNVEVAIDTGFGISEVTLLVDSGNLAKEPVSGRYVIIVSPSALPMCFDSRPDEWPLESIFIPIETASGQDGLYGFFPKEIRRCGKKLDACIAIGPNISYDGCDGIIPKNII